MDVRTVTRPEAGVGSVETLIIVMSALNFHLAGIARGDT